MGGEMVPTRLQEDRIIGPSLGFGGRSENLVCR